MEPSPKTIELRANKKLEVLESFVTTDDCKNKFTTVHSLLTALLGEIDSGRLKDPSHPQPFSVPSELLILLGEETSYYLTVSSVPESSKIISSSFTWNSFVATSSE